MKKILLLFVLCIFSYSSQFDYDVYRFKKYFLSISTNEVASYLYNYVKNNYKQNIHNYFSYSFSYNYDYIKGTFYLKIIIPEYISKNYKKKSKFINVAKKDMIRMLCHDYIFQASLYTKIRIDFSIVDHKDTHYSDIFNKYSVLTCNLIR